MKVMDDPKNAGAFGEVSGDWNSEANCAFEDNFVPPLHSIASQQDASDGEEWRKDGYLQSLEAKLQKLKGRSMAGGQTKKQLTSREILHTLDAARQDSARHLVSSDSVNLFSDDCPLGPLSTDTQVPAIKRRIFPEQALSPEELEELTRRDFLQAATRSQEEEEEREKEEKEEEELSGSR